MHGDKVGVHPVGGGVMVSGAFKKNATGPLMADRYCGRLESKWEVHPFIAPYLQFT